MAVSVFLGLALLQGLFPLYYLLQGLYAAKSFQIFAVEYAFSLKIDVSEGCNLFVAV